MYYDATSCNRNTCVSLWRTGLGSWNNGGSCVNMHRLMTHVTHPKSDPHDPLAHDPSTHCLLWVPISIIAPPENPKSVPAILWRSPSRRLRRPHAPPLSGFCVEFNYERVTCRLLLVRRSFRFPFDRRTKCSWTQSRINGDDADCMAGSQSQSPG